jgi:hypothetical protein
MLCGKQCRPDGGFARASLGSTGQMTSKRQPEKLRAALILLASCEAALDRFQDHPDASLRNHMKQLRDDLQDSLSLAGAAR